MDGLPFNLTGLYLQDAYDAGYTGLFLMDCKALIQLAQFLQRDAAATELQRRFNIVDAAMHTTLWDESRGSFVNKHSADLTVIDRMAPTHFYPLLAATSNENQVRTMIKRHLTNATRFAVWPTGSPPEPPPPPASSRPLVQWVQRRDAPEVIGSPQCSKNWEKNIDYNGNDIKKVPGVSSKEQCCELCVNLTSCNAVSWDGPQSPWPASQTCNMKTSSAGRRSLAGMWATQVRPEPPGPAPPPPAPKPTRGHVLCCSLSCNFAQRNAKANKLRYEGLGLASAPPGLDPPANALYVFKCPGAGNSTDSVLAPAAWLPASGTPCPRADPGGDPEMWSLSRRSSPELIELELWWSESKADHWVIGSDASKAEAAASGYSKTHSLGFVWPPPGTANATSRYPLPAISKDDPTYIQQNYWRGRIWSPMLQIVYWGLREYSSIDVAAGAANGLVMQSKALLLKEWRGYGSTGTAGTGRYVYENFDADTGEGYGYSSEAQPLYSWGALAGFIGLQHNGFYDPQHKLNVDLIV